MKKIGKIRKIRKKMTRRPAQGCLQRATHTQAILELYLKAGKRNTFLPGILFRPTTSAYSSAQHDQSFAPWLSPLFDLPSYIFSAPQTSPVVGCFSFFLFIKSFFFPLQFFSLDLSGSILAILPSNSQAFPFPAQETQWPA